jgi:hypothetical protein
MREPLTSPLQNRLRRSGLNYFLHRCMLFAQLISRRNKFIERLLFLSASHRPAVTAVTILTGYLAEIYFASLRFIVQGLSFCQTQNQRLLIRRQPRFFLSSTQAAGTGKDGDKNRISRNDLTDYNAARPEAFQRWVIRRRRGRQGKLRG